MAGAPGESGTLPGDDPPGGGPPCAICALTGPDPRRLVYLTHGVAVWLCQTHAADRFMREDDGTVFADHLASMWIAAGALTVLRAAALRTHIRQTRSAGVARDRPGSYSWPVLRREAEQRFAAGDDPPSGDSGVTGPPRRLPGHGAVTAHHAPLVHPSAVAHAVQTKPAGGEERPETPGPRHVRPHPVRTDPTPAVGLRPRVARHLINCGPESCLPRHSTAATVALRHWRDRRYHHSTSSGEARRQRSARFRSPSGTAVS